MLRFTKMETPKLVIAAETQHTKLLSQPSTLQPQCVLSLSLLFLHPPHSLLSVDSVPRPSLSSSFYRSFFRSVGKISNDKSASARPSFTCAHFGWQNNKSIFSFRELSLLSLWPMGVVRGMKMRIIHPSIFFTSYNEIRTVAWSISSSPSLFLPSSMHSGLSLALPSLISISQFLTLYVWPHRINARNTTQFLILFFFFFAIYSKLLLYWGLICVHDHACSFILLVFKSHLLLVRAKNKQK